jgi:ComF family protein
MACGLVLEAREFHGGLCSKCEEALAPRKGGYCPTCGKLAANEEEKPALCSECRLTPRPWDGFAFHSSYDGLLRELILQFKFRSGLGHTRLLQKLCREACDRHLSLWRFDLIVPVPMHAARLRHRGFNQSMEFARGLKGFLRAPVVPEALQRTRPTSFQSGLTRKQRGRNLNGALWSDPDWVEEKKVLVVDDIMTTGATLLACAQSLTSAGAASVAVLVLGRVPEPGS